jgi:hypothetical protein
MRVVMNVEEDQHSHDDEDVGQALVRREQITEPERQDRENGVLADEQHERLRLHGLRVVAHPAARARDDQQDGPHHADEHRQPEELRLSGRRLEDPEVAEVRNEAGANRLESLGERPDELALQHVSGEPAENQHAGERHDEGRDLAVRDEIALARANEAAQDQRKRDDQLPGKLDVDVGPGNMKSHHHDRRAAADESNDGTDGKIDVAPNDHQQHAERHDDDVAVLEDEVGHINAAEEYAASDNLKERHDEKQGNKQPVVAKIALPEARVARQRLSGGHAGDDRFRAHAAATPYCFMIEAMIISCVAPFAGISSTNLPSFMT